MFALINIFKHKIQVFIFFLGEGTHAIAPKVREPITGAGSPLPHIGPACQTWIGRFGSSIFTHWPISPALWLIFNVFRCSVSSFGKCVLVCSLFHPLTLQLIQLRMLLFRSAWDGSVLNEKCYWRVSDGVSSPKHLLRLIHNQFLKCPWMACKCVCMYMGGTHGCTC